MKVHSDVAGLIRAGLSNRAIARQLGVAHTTVAAARDALGMPPSPHHPVTKSRSVTLEEAWRAHTRPVDDGHLVWTGRVGSGGAKVMRYRGRLYTANRVAFMIRTGRDPVGRAKPACDVPGCVAPGCMDDAEIRRRDRLALRAVLGLPAPDGACGRGHDQAVYGRLEPDGKPYCAECDRLRLQKRRAAS